MYAAYFYDSAMGILQVEFFEPRSTSGGFCVNDPNKTSAGIELLFAHIRKVVVEE